jgi:hypothetical protein
MVGGHVPLLSLSAYAVRLRLTATGVVSTIHESSPGLRRCFFAEPMLLRGVSALQHARNPSRRIQFRAFMVVRYKLTSVWS